MELIRSGAAKAPIKVQRLRGNVSALEGSGGKPTAEYDTRWGQFVITPEFFTKLVYGGV